MAERTEPSTVLLMYLQRSHVHHAPKADGAILTPECFNASYSMPIALPCRVDTLICHIVMQGGIAAIINEGPDVLACAVLKINHDKGPPTSVFNFCCTRIRSNLGL